MKTIEMENQQNTSGNVDILQQALDRPVNIPCIYHDWVKHEDTLMEYCERCKVRKDEWEDGQEKNEQRSQTVTNGENTPMKTQNSKLPEALQKNIWKPGQSGNPAGRPKGSKNLTTIVMEVLKSKVYKTKDSNGKTVEMSGEEAFAEAVLSNAINKKDRESLRMLWEFADGKPKQSHSISVGPKGYEVDPEQESIVMEQFQQATGIINTIQDEPEGLPQGTMLTNEQAVVLIENTPSEGKSDEISHANDTKPTTGGVQENTQNNPGGVREV